MKTKVLNSEYLDKLFTIQNEKLFSDDEAYLIAKSSLSDSYLNKDVYLFDTQGNLLKADLAAIYIAGHLYHKEKGFANESEERAYKEDRYVFFKAYQSFYN